MRKIFILAALVLVTAAGISQERPEPPMLVETFVGHERVGLTLSTNKKIDGKFRYFGILSTMASYDYKKSATELVSVNSLAYQFHPHLGVSVGTQYHFAKGFIPNVALHSSYARPDLFLMLTPYFNFMPWNNIETLAIVEYKPALTDKMRLYSRFQGFYGHNIDAKTWERGMAYFRLGVMKSKYAFGAGANFDYYHINWNEIEKQNYGAFVQVYL